MSNQQIKNKFEQLAKDNQPEQYGGPVRWSHSGNTGGMSNEGKFKKSGGKPRPKPGGPPPAKSLTDLP
jgi:hypothetical protein